MVRLLKLAFLAYIVVSFAVFELFVHIIALKHLEEVRYTRTSAADQRG
jgi:hypothetical protein